MKEWKDCSSYSRGDKKRVPTVWEYKLGDLRICVHRHIYCPNDMWLLSCNLFYDKQELSPLEIEQAKTQAIAMVQIKLQDALDELKEVIL